MASQEQLIAELRTFILENYLFTDDQSELNNSDSFLANKILDSMGVLELTAFLEQSYGIALDDHELIPENLDSIDKLVRFVIDKTGH